MDSTKKIKLIAEHRSRGSFGQEIVKECEREIWATLQPISRNEWTTAGQRGVEAIFRVLIYTFEYHDELTVEIDGQRYGVYRSYIDMGNDKTELYLESKAGITFAECDDVPEEEIEAYLKVYSMLSNSGIPTFYGDAPKGQKLPYLVYDMDSNNFAADNKVYSQGYDLVVSLYEPRKSLRLERAVERAFDSSDVYWEREESDEIDERMFVQRYAAEIRG